jgi:hypothetical protein
MFSSPRFTVQTKKKIYHAKSESSFQEVRHVFLLWTEKTVRFFLFLIRVPFLFLALIALYPLMRIKKIFARMAHGASSKKHCTLKNHVQAMFRRWPAPHARIVHKKHEGMRVCIRMRTSHQKKSTHFWRTRRVGGVAGVAVILALPFMFSNLIQELSLVRAQTAEHAARGIKDFSRAQDGFEEFRTRDMKKSFQQALADFENAQKSMEKINTGVAAIARVVPGKGSALADGKALIDAGQDIARAGTHVARAADAFQPPFQLFSSGFLDAFQNMNNELKIADPFLAQADARLESVNADNIPAENRAQFLQLRALLHVFSNNIKDVTDLGDGMIRVFAKNQLRRYLIVFQNNTELRATGGFIGSYALVDFADGAIRNIEIPPGGPYDLQGSLRETVQSPQPLHIVNPIWQFQDANWFPDFPTSAKKLMWFYEKSGGPTVDGVIAINERVAEKIIQYTGPITMSEYGKTITAENFLQETQKSVEIEYDKEKNTPKKFIADLIPKVIRTLQERAKEDVVGLIQIFSTAVQERDIQLYMRSSPDQTLFQRFGAGGELRATRGDYSMIVDTNVGGGKSDGVITQSVRHTLTVKNNGTCIVHLHIQRDHHGNRQDPFTGIRNIDYMRIYTPYGSKVLSVSGFQEIDPSLFKTPPMEYHLDSDLKAIERDERYDAIKKVSTHTELGKTVISGWVVTDVGLSRDVDITYQLPFTAEDIISHGYSLLIQRQSGSRIQSYVYDVVFDSQWIVDWRYPSDVAMNRSALNWETREFKKDVVFGFTLQKKL